MNENSKTYKHVCTAFAVGIILLGISLRVKVLLDNRCLWLDEASVARNIFERNFAGLLQPLDYYQYAPPLYLWIVKLSALLFNYSEIALRLWSVISGIGCLIVLWRILKREADQLSALYPLFLAATGFFFVRYGTELKQYIPDMFISSVLIYLTLRVDVLMVPVRKFAAIWIVVGSLAIWASMPSVFILAGIGLYYGLLAISTDRRKLFALTTIAVIWTAQFLCYYLLILKPQIHSGYLQHYHQRFFLFATPGSAAEWIHNKDVTLAIVKMAGGDEWYAVAFNLGLFAIGIICLLRKSLAKAILLLTPIVFLLAAAAINQYSLIPRLTLFATPLLYIMMACGFWQLTQISILKFAVVPIAIICGFSYQSMQLFTQPFEQEEITRGLDYLKEKGVRNNDLYVVTGAEHAFLYYTEMHPHKDKWQSLRNAHLLPAVIDYDSLAASVPAKPAFLYTIVFDSFDGKKKLDSHMQLTDSFSTQGCHVFIYRKP